MLGTDRAPITGLYAVGNDMASIMGGNYPSGGITLGPAMTFGYLAGRHLANVTWATDSGAGGFPARVRSRGGDRHVALPAEDQFA